LAHSDLSPNNVLVDPTQGASIVIDVDSLVVEGLFGVGLGVLAEAVRRLLDPPPISSAPMAAFGALGLAGNLISIAVLVRVKNGGLNARAALLEVVNDALGAAAVLVTGGLIWFTGWTRADAVTSILIAVLILPRTWRLIRETTDVLLETAPPDLPLGDVREHLAALPGVLAVHDLHASRISTDLRVLTAHLVVEPHCFDQQRMPALLLAAQGCLADHFDVEHSTFQFEPPDHQLRELLSHHCGPEVAVPAPRDPACGAHAEHDHEHSHRHEHL
jgi:cobalt-zinc-cadmium efflux system protein